MWTKRLLSASLALAGTIALIECSDVKSSSTAPEHPLARALFGGRPIEYVPIAEVTRYASTLRFNMSAPSADDATIRDSRGETIQLRAEPVADASEISDQDRVGGRIIARITSNAPYAPLGLAAGVNYFWVDGAGDGARAVVIPANGSARSVRSLMLRQHAYGNVMLPTARFVSAQGVSPAIPLVNARCGAYCCGLTTSGLSDKDLAALDVALLEMHRRIASGIDH